MEDQSALAMDTTNMSSTSVDDVTECSWYTAQENRILSFGSGVRMDDLFGDANDDRTSGNQKDNAKLEAITNAVNEFDGFIVDDSVCDAIEEVTEEEDDDKSDVTPKAVLNCERDKSVERLSVHEDFDADGSASSDGTLNIAVIGAKCVLRGIVPSFSPSSAEGTSSENVSVLLPTTEQEDIGQQDQRKEDDLHQKRRKTVNKRRPMLGDMRKIKSQEDAIEKVPSQNSFFISQPAFRDNLRRISSIHPPLSASIKHALANFRSLALHDQLHSFSHGVRLGGAEWKLYIKCGTSKKLGLFLVLSSKTFHHGGCARKLMNKSTDYNVKMTVRILHPISHCAPFTKSIMRKSKVLTFQPTALTTANNVLPDAGDADAAGASSCCWGFANMAPIDMLTSSRGGFVDFAGTLALRVDFTILRTGDTTNAYN